jgi:uncharacterized membrane protein YfhO
MEQNIDFENAVFITGDSDTFKILDFDVNHIKFYTNFLTPKFLVYNDSYHDGWEGFINGECVAIVRANVAFKGLSVPPGENVILMRYLPVWRHRLNLFFVLFFLGFFICVLYKSGEYYRNE